MQGNLISLPNGLTVSVDWLSFTVMSTGNLVDVLDMFGYVMEDFTRMPKGARGYKTMYRLNGFPVSVLCDGTPNMGIHIDISGTAISEFLRSYSESLKVATPFREGYDIDFDSTFLISLLELIRDNGHVTRLDIAIDDLGGNYFTINDICRLYENTQIVSKFRNMRSVVESEVSGKKTGHTLYFGSRTSDIFLRIYDKQLEQNKKLSASDVHIDTPWVRWELELKNDRAVSVAKMLISGIPLGTVAVGVLSHYMRIIELDDSNRSRCSINEVWSSFIDGLSPLKLTVMKYDKTLDDKRKWVKRQVMPTLAAILLADGGSIEFIENNLENAVDRMSPSLYRMAMSAIN